MSSTQMSAMHLYPKAIGTKRGGATRPFPRHLKLSTNTALGCLAREWDRHALRGPVPQYVESRVLNGLRLGRRINWSTVLALTFNLAVWMFVVITLSMVID